MASAPGQTGPIEAVGDELVSLVVEEIVIRLVSSTDEDGGGSLVVKIVSTEELVLSSAVKLDVELVLASRLLVDVKLVLVSIGKVELLLEGGRSTNKAESMTPPLTSEPPPPLSKQIESAPMIRNDTPRHEGLLG